jgi:dihydroorotate dehydrogenase electron transfer subunit
VSQAPFGRRALTVTAIEELGAYRVLRVADPGPEPEPGQFSMLAAIERWGGGEDERPFLPRAFSVARRRDGESHYLLEDVGPGTRRLCELREGDQLWTLGPLGRGFRAPAPAAPAPQRRAILVGGGVGIAPLAILQDSLAAPATVLLGFRDRAHAAGAALLSGARVATDDGSVGERALVTELLEAELALGPAAVVYACGPPGMLEGVRALCERTGTPAQLALEAGMACGFGACFGCAVPRRGGGYLRVCLDGPVVDAELLQRVEDPGERAEIGQPA